MAKDFKLDISMFERLMKCGISHQVLKTQRRMRPEIARLIHPFYVDTKYVIVRWGVNVAERPIAACFLEST